MRFKSRAALVAAVLSAVFSTGCGDTFRPIAIPIIQPGGQPQALREVVVLSTAGTGAEGDTTHINVSGDTNVGQVVVGRDPIHMAIIGNGSLTIVVNRGEESINVYPTLQPSLAQPPTTVNLPVGSVPRYAYSNVAGTVYIAESGSNKVGVVNLTGFPTALVAEVFVGAGATPVALVGPPDGSRLYVANQGSNTVSVIDTGTNALLVGSLPIAVGSAPSFLAVNSTGTRIFSVNTGSNDISLIDTSTNTAVNVPVGTAPNFAYFDATNNRLWVTNPGSDSVSSINVDPNSASYKVVTPIALGAGCAPKSITVLADGSRAYVANSGCSSVSVINALSNTVTKTIAVGTTPLSIVSSPDSSKIYTANNGSANISIIRTSDDTVANTLAAPAGTSPIFVAISPF